MITITKNKDFTRTKTFSILGIKLKTTTLPHIHAWNCAYETGQWGTSEGLSYVHECECGKMSVLHSKENCKIRHMLDSKTKVNG